MSNLTNKDAELFYKITNELIYFANSRFKFIDNFPKANGNNWEEEDIYKIVEKIFSKPEIIVSFYSENPAMLNKEEIDIVKSWNKFVKGKFLVFSKNSKAIFFSSEKEPRAYEVNGIYDDILDLIPFEPIMIEAILVPFKGCITYIGYFRLYKISFGSGYQRGLMADFEKSKLKFGIISSLENPIEEKIPSNEEILRVYLKNKQNRDEFWSEIGDLLIKNPSLKSVYYNEIGKLNVRDVKKCFSEIGIKSGWFAIVNSQVVACGKTKEEISERLKDVLPDDIITSAHIFEYKGEKEK